MSIRELEMTEEQTMNVSIKQADPGIKSTMTPSLAIGSNKPFAARLCGLMLAALAVTAAGNALAADVYLKVSAFDKIMPDGSTHRMWGFAECTGVDTDGVTLTGCGSASAPGPQINATTGDTLNITVQNTLDVPVSVMVPGQASGGSPATIMDSRSRNRATSLTSEIAALATGMYTIPSLKEGTYLYQSGTVPQLQVPMGLYGALVVTGPDYPAAVADPVILFSEIDPVQNARVDAAATALMAMGPECLSLAEYDDPTSINYRATAYPCTIDYKPTHLLVNGGSGFDLTTQSDGITALAAGDTVLLRYLNAGQKMHTPSIVGLEQDVIAEDGNLYPGVPTRVPRVQSVIMLPPNGTKDAIATLAGADIKLSLFDRQPGFRNDSELEDIASATGPGPEFGGITLGTPAAPVLAAMHVVNDEYSTPEDTVLDTENVSNNDTFTGNVLHTVAVPPAHGTVSFNGFGVGGSFVYTPDANFSGTDTFQYSVCPSTGGAPATRTCSGPAEVGLVTINVSYVNDAPIANNDEIPVNGTGSSIVFTAADILANDIDADGDVLQVGTVSTLAGLAYNAGTGEFTYAGGIGTFDYQACDPALACSTATVSLPASMSESNITLIVEDTTPGGTGTLTDYQWTVEEDITYQPDPTSPPSYDVLALGFHKSYLPVVAQGHGAAEFAALALDPTKHYYVSVLPDDNGNKDDPGHATGGAQFMGDATEVRVDVYPTPTVPAQISIKVFNDNASTNGAWDNGEAGLGGFAVTIEDGGGRYGFASGMVSYDMDGLPLTNALDCFGTFGVDGDGNYVPGTYVSVPAKPGVILTCPNNAYTRSIEIDGEALVKNVYPAKYGIIVTPPEGQAADWVQTSTIEGTKVNDVWVKSGEPAYFQEFGPPGWHNFTGFVRPDDLDNNGAPDNFLTGGNSVTGMVTNAHISRPPLQTIWDSGSYDALAHTRAWIAVNSANGAGPTIAAKMAEEDGSFTISGLPDGDYQLAIWDRYLDQVLAYKSFSVSAATTTAANVGNIPVFNWFGRLEHSVFQDDGGTCGSTSTAALNGVWDNTDPDVNTTIMVGTAQDCNEAFMQEQNVNLRWRDGTIYASFPTDGSGYVPFDQVFPFFHWLIAEIDYARFMPTGVTVAVDNGGDVASQPAPFTGLLAPQQQLLTDPANVSTDPDWRTELGSNVLLEGYQQFLGQTSKFQWGKVEWPLGQNGGIAGIVYYATTRAENDARLAAAEPWEPGIADAKVRLYRKFTSPPVAVTELVDTLQEGEYTLTQALSGLTTTTTGGPGGPTTTDDGTYRVQLGVMDLDEFVVLAEDYDSIKSIPGGLATVKVRLSVPSNSDYLGAPLAARVITSGSSVEGLRSIEFNEANLVFVNEVTTDNWDASLPTGCPGADAAADNPIFGLDPAAPATNKCYDGMRNWNQARPAVFDGGYAFNEDQDGNPLKPGTYVVEVEVPKGYQILKEEDVNVGFGESYARVPVDVVYPSGGTATVPGPEIVGDRLIGDVGIAQARCVGTSRVVPAVLSLYPAMLEPAPFAGVARPLCDRREVELVDQAQANAEFWLFTPSPISGHGVGMILDDTAQEFNIYSPAFSEKWAPPYVPVSIRRGIDGKEIGRVVSDQYGRFNLLVPVTASADLPSSSGAAPGMLVTCMNDPGPIPDGAGGMMIDPNFNPAYSNFCYTLQYMPGTTTYLDTPVLPVAAFASGFSPADCAQPTGSPKISAVETDLGDGPLVRASAGGTTHTVTLHSVGMADVPNPDYLGPLDPAGAPRLVTRDYGFGAPGQVTLDGVPLTIVSWTNDTITVNAPTSNTTGELLVTNGSGVTSESGITLTVSDISEANVRRVPLEHATIQAAIDAANPGDIVLVSSGTYNERVIMYKPVKLQGSGLGTLINGVINPTQSLADWRAKIDCLFGITAGCTQVINELPGQGPGSEGLLDSEGATVSVFAPSAGPASFAGMSARIDGFSITGSSTAGGVFVNGWAHDLAISNNDVFGNSGGLHGGIRVGEPDLQLAAPAGSGVSRAYDFNHNVKIAYNIVRQNGSVGVAGAGGVGGGVSIMAGADGYQVSDNFVCGNFTLGDGAGVGHYGLSQGGLIENNTIVMNQSFEQTFSVDGGGIFIGGEPASIPLTGGELITPGAGSVNIIGNLIQGNHAGAGSGGGIRLQFVNGADAVTATLPGDMDQVTIDGNTIVNNVAGNSGAGVSMIDALSVSMTGNTIAHNDSTATVGGLISVVGGVNSSVAQPSGVVAEVNSPTAAGVTGLYDVIAAKPDATWGSYKAEQYSNPSIMGGQIWENRSFSYHAGAAAPHDTPHLDPMLSQATVGACDAGADYWDLAVLNTAIVLTTSGTVLTGDAGFGGFTNAYCNGGRTVPGPIEVFPAVDEAGATWIDVRFGPLSVFGDYSLAP